jgi:arginyl-tRNA synthetase
MNVFHHFREEIVRSLDRLAASGRIPAGLDFNRVTVEPPREEDHGDLSTNAAMVLSKAAGMRPRVLAELLAEPLRALAEVRDVAVAGPGFVNLRVKDSFWQARIVDVLKAGTAYGSSAVGAGVRVNVEYVSANPTGPLHLAHARGAVFGDALAVLLAKVGFAVTKEYYINDAGAQVDTLARSVHLRYREALGDDIGTIPVGLYPGDYLKEVGQALVARDGDKWRGAPESEWLAPVRQFAINAMMALIRADLHAIGVDQDVFTSERALVEAGGVERALKRLSDLGVLYVGTLSPPKGKSIDDWEPRPQTLFRATDFGDDVDRPLKKSDGSWTYFAADIANHYDKFQRGFPVMIDVWGADHGGYVKRMQAAVKAITAGKGALDVKICQLVTLLRNGQPVRMSKRAGTFVALSDVVDEVGKDVVRFIMLTRKNDSPLEFDLSKVIEQSRGHAPCAVGNAEYRCRAGRADACAPRSPRRCGRVEPRETACRLAPTRGIGCGCA